MKIESVVSKIWSRTDRQTHRHAHRNTPLHYRDGVTTAAAAAATTTTTTTTTKCANYSVTRRCRGTLHRQVCVRQSYVRWQRGTARICCCAPCSGPLLLRREPCCNRSPTWSPSPTRGAGPTQQTRRTLLQRAIVADRRTDKRTARRTDTVPLHRPCCAYYAGSANQTDIKRTVTHISAMTSYASSGILNATHSVHPHLVCNALVVELCTSLRNWFSEFY